MPNGMLTKECPQIELIDTILDPMFKSDNNDVVIHKFHIVRNSIINYHRSHYTNDILNDSEYPMFLFDVGMFTGTMLYYKKHRNLTKDHIEDLNKIYKKYKQRLQNESTKVN